MSFKDEMTTDLSKVFLNTDEFAVVVSYRGQDIKAQFLEEYDEGAETFYKRIWCRYIDVPSISKDETITYDGVVYGVVDFKVDDFKDGINIYLNEVLS